MPKIENQNAETEGLLVAVKAMAVAARTAPKAREVDAIETIWDPAAGRIAPAQLP